jgi:hypothetical protein
MSTNGGDGRQHPWGEQLATQRWGRRKNTVVRRLNVGAHPSTSKRFPKAQALAELKRYAVKQKAHAGSG